MAFFRKKTAPAAPAVGKPEYIIAGLGNPGEKYEYSRHNTGFLCLDVISNRCGVKPDRLKFGAVTAAAAVGGVPCLLMRPQTYMNNSGDAVREAAAFYKIPPRRYFAADRRPSHPPEGLRRRAQRHQKHHRAARYRRISAPEARRRRKKGPRRGLEGPRTRQAQQRGAGCSQRDDGPRRLGSGADRTRQAGGSHEPV